jgi:hypothetical protein
MWVDIYKTEGGFAKKCVAGGVPLSLADVALHGSV